MRVATAVLAGLLASSSWLIAQENSRFEIFGGYSLEHVSACGEPGDAFLPCARFTSDGFSRPVNYNGWNASITRYFYRYLGFTADFAGHYGTTTVLGAAGPASASTSRYSYMFGPAAAFRKNSGTLFAQALFGGVTNNFGTFVLFQGSATAPGYTSFAWAVGGGLDINTSRRLAVRLGQFDYERVNTPGGYPPVSGFRYSVGIVLKH